MKTFKILLLIFSLPILMSTSLHKYYVSITEIEYVKEKKSVQIITRLFVDDLENVLRQRYDEHLSLVENKELDNVNMYLQRYIKEKLQIKINGKLVQYDFIGKEYQTDIVYVYLEIKDVNVVNSFEMVNTLLFDRFDDQQNIVKTNINSKKESFILIPQNDKGVLNFK